MPNSGQHDIGYKIGTILYNIYIYIYIPLPATMDDDGQFAGISNSDIFYLADCYRLTGTHLIFRHERQQRHLTSTLKPLFRTMSLLPLSDLKRPNITVDVRCK